MIIYLLNICTIHNATLKVLNCMVIFQNTNANEMRNYIIYDICNINDIIMVMIHDHYSGHCGRRST